MIDQILDAWDTNHRITLHLLDHVDRAGMRCTMSTRGGRGVAGQFAHMHNNRVWHLEKRAADLAEGLQVFPAKTVPSKAALTRSLTASTAAIATFFQDLSEGQTRRKGFRHGLPAALAYFVAHESHHRGIILATLKHCGHPVPTDARYAMWGMWDKA